MKQKPTGKPYFNENYKDFNIIHVPLKFAIISKRIRKKLIRILEKSKSIVDLGCGTGGTLKLFREINPKSSLVGVDCSDVALKKVLTIMPCDKNLELIDADLNDYQLKINNFDLVYCSQLLEHLPKPDEFIKNIHQSLKSDGILLLSTVYRKKFSWYFYKNKYGQIALAPDHINEYSDVNVLLNQLKKSGFKVQDYDLSMFNFPVIDLLIKPVMKLLRGKIFFELFNSKLIMQLRFYLAIPIFGFYNFQVIAKKI